MLIQSVLFFILGIAATTLVLILLAPAIWRRALYLARKQIAQGVPLSLTEIEADRDFLRAKQAVELVKRDEKFERLSEKYANQKRELDHAKEELWRLSGADERANLLSEQLADGQEELETEKQLVATLESNKGKTVEEIRDQLIEERKARAANRIEDDEIKRLEDEVATLKSKLAEATRDLQQNKITKADMDKLREEIMDTAAKFTANVAISEGASSPIPDLVKQARGKKSLAARIKNDLKAEKQKQNKRSAPKKPAKRKTATKANKTGKPE